MKLLLDAAALLMALQDSKTLGPKVRQRMTDAEAIYVSALSLYELQVAVEEETLSLPAGLPRVLERSGFSELPVSWEHVAAMPEVRSLRQGPLVQLLVAQAQREQLVIVTANGAILEQYPGLCLDPRK